MGIFSKKKNIDSLTASNILEVCAKALHEPIEQIIEKKESKPENLALFTVFSSIATTFNMLNHEPNLVKVIGKVFCECRLYYDCMWQLYLLEKHHSDMEKEKISKLYANVDFKIYASLRTQIERVPESQTIFGRVISKGYSEMLYDAVLLYIHGTGRAEIKDDNIYLANGMGLGLRMEDIFSENRINIDSRSLWNVLAQETNRALSLKLLTDFDLMKCEIIDFPENYYK